MVNVCGRPFEAKRKFLYLYGKIDHKGELAEAQGYYANRPIITYFVIYMAIISITRG